MKGEDGAAGIAKLMEKLREAPAAMPGGEKILAVRDYRSGIRKECSGRSEKISLPVSNVLYYELEDGAWCCARPSGTEPKIKFYYGVKGRSGQDAVQRLERLKTGLLHMAGQEDK
jgi:phosphoglucomutase